MGTVQPSWRSTQQPTGLVAQNGPVKSGMGSKPFAGFVDTNSVMANSKLALLAVE